MVTIRKFEIEDSETVAAITNEAFEEEIAKGMPRFTAENVVESSQRHGVNIFAAEDRGHVAGFIMHVESRMGYPAQIHLVGVRKEFRGRGIGRMLAEHAIEHSKNIGDRKIRLYTRPWNVPMSKICIGLGFVPEAYLRKEFLNEDLVQYSLFL